MKIIIFFNFSWALGKGPLCLPRDTVVMNLDSWIFYFFLLLFVMVLTLTFSSA
jgi:hypothetical protein